MALCAELQVLGHVQLFLAPVYWYQVDGFDISMAPWPHGAMPLMVAADKSRIECVNLLLSDDRVDPNIKNNAGETPLMIATRKSSAQCVKALIRDDRVDPNIRDNNGSTPLLFVLFVNDVERLQLLLSNGKIGRLSCWYQHEGQLQEK